jgi:hypothetical protein
MGLVDGERGAVLDQVGELVEPGRKGERLGRDAASRAAAVGHGTYGYEHDRVPTSTQVLRRVAAMVGRAVSPLSC